MDKKTILALLALASAAESPALAQQVRQAEKTGDAKHISQTDLLRAVYKVSLNGNGAEKALIHLGYNAAEASQITKTASKIASDAGSYENFRSIVEGKVPKGIKLSEQETALIRSVTLTTGGGGRQGRRMWEGTKGRTWEGRA